MLEMEATCQVKSISPFLIKQSTDVQERFLCYVTDHVAQGTTFYPPNVLGAPVCCMRRSTTLTG